MLRKFMKKRVILALSVVGALAIAGSALAFFTSTGNGTGSASVGHATTWSVGQELGVPSTGGPLYPDTTIGTGHIQTDTYYVKNSGNGNQNLTSVVISVADSSGNTWSAVGDGTNPPCTASDFSVDGAAVGAAATDTSVAGDLTTGQTKTAPVTVQLIDNGLNQNNCQGVTVPLYFSAS
jgi:hypothetical protein